MDIIYLDRLSVCSLTSAAFCKAKGSRVYYFDKSPAGGLLAGVFQFLRLLKNKPESLELILGEIRDDRGECQFIRISEDIRKIVLEISRLEFSGNALLDDFKPLAEPGKIAIFLEKKLSEDIQKSVVYLNAARWNFKAGERESNKIVFFLEGSAWAKYLETYAKGLGVQVCRYRSPLRIFILFLFKTLGLVCSGIFRVFAGSSIKQEEIGGVVKKRDSSMSKQKARIGSLYTARPINFDLRKRSDLFWLLTSDIEKYLVTVYFDRQDLPLTESIAGTLSQQGLSYWAMSPKSRDSSKVPLWSSGRIYSTLFRSWLILLASSFLKRSGGLESWLFYYRNLADFGKKQSFWQDFFFSNEIKVNISAYDFYPGTVAMNSALESLGGVSISYQFSNLWFSSIVTGCSADVLFLFSPSYRWVWKNNNSRIRQDVSCGYITDYVFNEVKEESLELRNKILARGADFIVCFFDENSGKERMSMIPDTRSAEIYKFFLEWLLKDKTLGVIFKPGYPKTLEKRLFGLKELISAAKKTRRCVFLENGGYVTDAYPAQAAQAADLSVGLLLSGTTALESYLSGKRTIFLDLEKLYSHPAYGYQGKSRIIFDDLATLYGAIQSFRSSDKKQNDFGDLSAVMRDKDNFRDGRAAQRMGSYIKWLNEAFSRGLARDGALEYANAKYADSWGKENIEKWH